MLTKIFIAGALAATLGLFSIARAGDPFLITAQSTSGTPETITAAGSNLPNLLNDLVKDKSQFAPLRNQSSSASIDYGTDKNAITVTKNAAGTSATVSIPSIGFTKTFTGASSSDLEKQIENYAKKNGADIYGNFIRSINQRTTLGVTDGNPLAATAIFANTAFNDFGLQPTPMPPGKGPESPLDLVATPNVRLDFNGGYSRTDAGAGYYAGGAFSFGVKFGERVGLVFTTPFEYRFISGAAVYDVAEEVSLPIVILPPQGSTNISWMLTPTGVGGGAGSVDLAAGGLFAGGGLTSSLSLQYAGFIFTLADQLDYYHGFPITIGDYKFDTNLDQTVAKNGLKITRYVGDNMYVDAGITYTEFLQRAAIGEYWSPTAGVGFRLGSNAGLRINYAGDFAPGFINYGGAIQFYLNY
jgi:hypothetical protein